MLILLVNISISYEQQETESPLKQFQSGTLIGSIKCSDSLQLMAKRENGYPACVSSSTFTRLVTRSWGYDPINVWTVNGLNDTYHMKNLIHFKIMFKDRTNCMPVPTVIVRNENGTTFFYAMPPTEMCSNQPPLYFESEFPYSFGLNKTGTYSVSIIHGSMEMQKKITIVQ